MNLLPKDPNGCPYLFLAPMEGLGDSCFRRAIAKIGGFDEAIQEFVRVPSNAHIPSLVSQYDPSEMAPYPMAAQLMGSDPELMAATAQAIEASGATHININCGCPSKQVTGKGSGSSLLKEPPYLHELVKFIVNSVSIPVTVKMRIGFHDTSLFKENLLAVQESGAKYVIIHPRTKVDGYAPPAKWEYIAEAKSLLNIPVVGNGDIVDIPSALNMLRQTGCDGLMIGRASVINPFIFHEIRSHFKGEEFCPDWNDFVNYLDVYKREVFHKLKEKNRTSKLKGLFSYLFMRNQALQEMRSSILSMKESDPEIFFQNAFSCYKNVFYGSDVSTDRGAFILR